MLKRNGISVAVAVTSLLAGCSVSDRAPARPDILRILDEKAHLLAGPETESASDAFSQDELARMRRDIAVVAPEILRQLKEGNHGYAHLALALDVREAMPALRTNLLRDRYFYCWEGPDYSQEEAYLLDEQYTHHTVYINALTGLSGKPIAEAVAITPAEVRQLEAEARKADLSRDDIDNAKYFCARWLLGKLRVTK